MPLHGEYEPSPADWVREQADTFERTNGQEANTMRGKPIILLTSKGAKSGKLRKNPLMRVEHDGKYAVIASQGGAPDNPAWYNNLIGESLVELQDGSSRNDYRAELVTGDDRRQWWDRAVEAWPDYAEYQKKTTREIPVFVLTRVQPA